MRALKRMWEIGLRGAAIRYPECFTIIFLVLVLGFGTYGNWKVLDLRGGILDDALPEDDPYSVMDREVRETGFNPQEVIPVLVKSDNGLTPESAKKLIRLSSDLKRLGGGVLSISEMPEYRDTDETLYETPYLTDSPAEKFDSIDLSKRLAADFSVEGILAAKNRSWISAVRFLPPGYSEPAEGWRMVEFVEGEKTPGWKRIFKADIHPKDPDIAVSGWVMGRWQIDQGINRDMILLPALGLFLALPIFLIFLGSWRQALIAALVNVVAGIWLARGAIWPLHAVYSPFHERVYTVLVYANIIVQGISFALHKLEAFRTARGATSQEKFLQAQSVDGTIVMVALIATSAFLSLNTFGVWQMGEMGVESIVGVSAVLAGALIFIPAVYLTVERLLGPEKEEAHEDKQEEPSYGRRLAGNILTRCAEWKYTALAAAVLPIGAFFASAYFFFSGGIEAKTKPWSYIEGSHVEQTFRFLEDSGNEYLDIIVRPKEGTIYRPDFIAAAWQFECALRSCQSGETPGFEHWQKENGFNPVMEFKEAGSVLGKVRQISQESYQKPLPTTNMEVDDIFFLLDSSSLDAEVKRQMWHPKAIRIIASAVMNDSAELNALIERMLDFAKAEFPELSVSVVGKMAIYPQVDRYITKGEASNILVSLFMAFLLYAAWAWIMRRGEDPQIYPIGILASALLMLIPFLFSVGCMGLLIYWRGIPLSMSTAPIFDLAVNAASDFSPYVMWAWFTGLKRRQKYPTEAIHYSLRTMGIVVAMDCLLNAIAFLPLEISAFQPVREVGWIMVLMLVCCGIGALVFIPAILSYITRRTQSQNSEKEASYEKGVHLRLVR